MFDPNNLNDYVTEADEQGCVNLHDNAFRMIGIPEALKRLHVYESLHKQGKLVICPIKPGTTVYAIEYVDFSDIDEDESCLSVVPCAYEPLVTERRYGVLGTRWFLTLVEAEKSIMCREEEPKKEGAESNV